VDTRTATGCPLDDYAGQRVAKMDLDGALIEDVGWTYAGP
jgi:hypothetical protein